MFQKIHKSIDDRPIEQVYRDTFCTECEHKGVCKQELHSSYEEVSKLRTLKCNFFDRGPVEEEVKA